MVQIDELLCLSAPSGATPQSTFFRGLHSVASASLYKGCDRFGGGDRFDDAIFGSHNWKLHHVAPFPAAKLMLEQDFSGIASFQKRPFFSAKACVPRVARSAAPVNADEPRAESNEKRTEIRPKKELLVTSASLLVTSALLVVTRS